MLSPGGVVKKFKKAKTSSINKAPRNCISNKMCFRNKNFDLMNISNMKSFPFMKSMELESGLCLLILMIFLILYRRNNK